ncbi:MAG: hypothetical protein KTR14_07015 [Vampirovibrio sp.]|nr:hypothetical protein [Vampirovibrio sp.]
MSTLASSINYLRNNTMVDTLFREITGNNIPHVVIVRNKDEFVDQSLSQFGNTAAYFGTGLLMDKGVNRATRKFQKTLSQAGKEWFRFGKSFGIYGLIATIMLGMPFLRNYITSKRTGTTDYAQMIGEKERGEVDQKKLKEATDGYLGRFLKTVSVGAALSSAILFGSLALAKKGRAMPKAIQWIHDKLSLEGGNFAKLSRWAAVYFWVTPTFTGLLAGSRDIYEKKELALRFAAFNLAFFVFPATVEKGIERLSRSLKPSKLLGSYHNVAYLGRFFSSLVFCSAVPTVLNIYLTRQRVKRDTAKQTISPFFADPATYTPIKRYKLGFNTQLQNSVTGW